MLNEISLSQIDFDALKAKGVSESLKDTFFEMIKANPFLDETFHRKYFIFYDFDWKEAIVSLASDVSKHPTYGSKLLSINEEVPLLQSLHRLSISLEDKSFVFYDKKICGSDVNDILSNVGFNVEVIDKDKGIVFTDNKGTMVVEKKTIDSFSTYASMVQDVAKKLGHNLKIEVEWAS